MKNKSTNYPTLFIGFTKMDVLKILGEGLNSFSDTQWIYPVKTKWWQRKSNLHIEFDKEDKVISQYTTNAHEK